MVGMGASTHTYSGAISARFVCVWEQVYGQLPSQVPTRNSVLFSLAISLGLISKSVIVFH